jgi:simple sugar transport system ATP-binding protein
MALEVRGVSKSFAGTAALRDVDLSIAVGESRALVGRNGAGKSTLISILTGLLTADQGTISIFGEEVGSGNRDAIGCVYQASTLAPDLTAAENIFVGHYPTRGGFVDWNAIRQRGHQMLEEWGLGRVSAVLVADLEPLEQKIVEICRALARGPKLLLLDEPTAGLDEGGSRALFEKVNALRERGVSIIYVSHHLQELFEVCDQVTVLRDGEIVSTNAARDLTIKQIVDDMVGDAQAAAEVMAEEHRGPASDEVIVAVEDVVIRDRVQGVSFQIRRGECYGITGLDGAGHIEIARALAGDLTLVGGDMTVGGRQLRGGGVGTAIARGVGFVPEDRRAAGYIPDLSVEENATLTIIDRLRNAVGIVNRRKRREVYDVLARTWEIKASGPTQLISELSGGNQQKVVLARALASDPTLLVLINPTAGIDVSAKESIYRTLGDLQKGGATILICSSDEQDLAVCDRVGVMFQGELTHEFAAGWSERDMIAATQGGGLAAAEASPPTSKRTPGEIR